MPVKLNSRAGGSQIQSLEVEIQGLGAQIQGLGAQIGALKAMCMRFEWFLKRPSTEQDNPECHIWRTCRTCRTFNICRICSICCIWRI